ncbi:hypothetical protein BC835DRAFT_1278970 [Cytidiella melzeri]|nr:hypothetical protein BC835DRAFT_1278970 [Cytidiella melzeri]
MLKIVSKYNTNLSAVRFSGRLLEQMPIRYHIGAIYPMRQLLTSHCGKCIPNVHNVHTVGDTIPLIHQFHNDHQNHTQRANCPCHTCTNIRTQTTCKNPAKCQTTAQTLLENLNIKWNPNTHTPINDPTLTQHQQEKNRHAHLDNSALTFNPSVTTGPDISEGFHTFTNPNSPSCEPAHQCAAGTAVAREAVTVYTDGSCIRNGDADAQPGSGVWYGPNNPQNLSL